MRTVTPAITISRARGASLYDADGIEYLDLSMGFGAAMLGHANEAVAAALARQAQSHASPGFFETDVFAEAKGRLAGWLPASHQLVGIYTGGVEAVETAMRIAAAHTGRRVFAGFAGARHGRSFMARALGGETTAEGVHSVPFMPGVDAGGVVEAVLDCLRRHRPSALFVEPIHMSGGGYCHDPAALAAVAGMAREHDCLVVFDELLTAGYRSGPRFYFEGAGIEPDLLLAGKALAGGVPAAVLSAGPGIDHRRAGSGWRGTYTDHPLTAAAIVAALDEMERLDAGERVASIAGIVEEAIPRDWRRGRGAMWCLEWPSESATLEAFNALLDERIVVSFSGRYVRLLPALVTPPDALERACRTLAGIRESST